MSTDEPWTIGRLLAWTIEYLGKRGAENPRLDAEVLLAHARGCRRIDLYAAYGDEAAEETRTAFRDLVRRRAAGEPVAYLVGHREFYALDFEVTPDVLIPRPETELLVVALLDHVKQRPNAVVRGSPDPARARTEGLPDDLAVGQERRPAVGRVAPSGDRPQQAGDRPQLEIADVGTGSGVLAVCAAKYVPEARVTAIDISPAALDVARRNAERHGVGERIAFVESDLFASVRADARFDYIVSNPPYVSTSELAELAVDVRQHEPRVALEAGEQGTETIERLIPQAAERLNAGGVLLIEISPMIAEKVEQIVRDNPALELRPTIRDLAGHARVVQAKVVGTLRVP